MAGHQSLSESREGNRARNVTVLLASDVNKRNDQVFMPNTIEMAKIKKKEKGQYVSRIQFSDNMSEEEVKRRLLLHFPNLENQRYIYTIVWYSTILAFYLMNVTVYTNYVNVLRFKTGKTTDAKLTLGMSAH